ncbi:cell wall metabolism sensor histidine kinase WalK [Myxococcota bacterium]|nr:cell wall metabolism sensor histidine kinase WalK [Myxococcota bacterium]
MSSRLSMYQHFLGVTLFLLSMAYGVVFLNTLTAVPGPGKGEAARMHVSRLHELALMQVQRSPDPSAACLRVGPFFTHSALVDAQRRIRTVCSGRAGHIANALRWPQLETFGWYEERFHRQTFGGGSLHRVALVEPAADDGERLWFFVSVELPSRTWYEVAGQAAWSFLPFLLFAFLLIWWKTRQVCEDLANLETVFESFRQGRLDARPPSSPIREVARLQGGIRTFAEETEAAQAMLHKERNELEAVFSAMTEGVVVLDPADRVTRMNRRAVELFPVNPERVYGQPLGELIAHPDLESLLSDGRLDTSTVRADLHFVSPQPRIVAVHCSRIRNAVGLLTGTLLVLEEVTLLRRLESVRREFSSNVSHELRTPITSILGFVETLREETSTATEEERRHYLEVIARSAGRLNAIVEDLLNLSRIELITDAQAAGLEPVELAGVLEAATGMCAMAARERDIRLQVEPVAGQKAHINASLFEQALVNVIDNAIKYSPEHTEVRIQMEQTGGELRIHVRDQGLGIPEKDLPHIFERFYRVDKSRSRKAGGTGLGLSIARHIMQVHGGTILVESRPGEGSCFTLALPEVPPGLRSVEAGEGQGS